MICVGTNKPESLENVIRWKAEIAEIEPEKPVGLVQTKCDLDELLDDDEKVSLEEIKAAKLEHGF